MDKENIAKFRKALRESDVTFSYKKKDGTVRGAHGTLCARFLPAQPVETVKFKCTDIDWDIYDEELTAEEQRDLPSSVTVTLTKAEYDEVADNEDALEEKLARELSNIVFCSVNSFCYERVEKRAPKKLPEGTVFYYDLDKKGYRSFNESQLINWSL